MNILMCSVGRRGELIKNFRKTMDGKGRIVATDSSPYAPALYFADKQYIVPKITEHNYIKILLEICVKEKINAIVTFIDPEISILSKNRTIFEEKNIKVLVPFLKSAQLCFDKFSMYQYLKNNNIPTIETFDTYESFMKSFQEGIIQFPVFVKPRTGSGSMGARKIFSETELQFALKQDPSLIIQEFMTGIDLDADVYVDTQSREVVSIFLKKKISTTIGGANKTISFKDERLFEMIKKINKLFDLYGPNDMDFFYKDDRYFLSEINPRFGGAYLHAYGAGIDFIKLIMNNVSDLKNESNLGNYENDIVMMMYDSAVIRKISE